MISFINYSKPSQNYLQTSVNSVKKYEKKNYSYIIFGFYFRRFMWN